MVALYQVGVLTEMVLNWGRGGVKGGWLGGGEVVPGV